MLVATAPPSRGTKSARSLPSSAGWETSRVSDRRGSSWTPMSGTEWPGWPRRLSRTFAPSGHSAEWRRLKSGSLPSRRALAEAFGARSYRPLQSLSGTHVEPPRRRGLDPRRIGWSAAWAALGWLIARKVRWTESVTCRSICALRHATCGKGRAAMGRGASSKRSRPAKAASRASAVRRARAFLWPPSTARSSCTTSAELASARSRRRFPQ